MRAARTCVADRRPQHDYSTTSHVTTGSTQMYTMQEALARDRMRERERQAHNSRLSAELSATHRWQYLAERARRAALRHAERASQASAVAPARP
jgi:hypothetical protein